MKCATCGRDSRASYCAVCILSDWVDGFYQPHALGTFINCDATDLMPEQVDELRELVARLRKEGNAP
jgi:hypothetical protein